MNSLKASFLLCLVFIIGSPVDAAEVHGKNPRADVEVSLEETQALPAGVETCILGRNANGRPTPRVLVRPEGVEFRDDAGKTRKHVTREKRPDQHMETHIYKGKRGKAIGVHITKGHSHSRESWTSGEYFIYDRHGHQTLHLPKFDDNTQPIPSPSGDYAVGWPGLTTPGGPPIFYDANGMRNKWAHGFSGKGWPDGFEVADIDFSDDGQLVGVDAKSGRRHRGLIFDSNGDKLSEIEHAGNILFSPAKNKLAFYKWGSGVALADAHGGESWVTSIEAFPEKFSADGSRMLARSGSFLAMIETGSGKEVWRWSKEQGRLKGKGPSGKTEETKMPQFSLRRAESNDDMTLIAVVGMSVKFEYLAPDRPQRRMAVDKDYFFLLNDAGELVFEKELPGGTFSIPDVDVMFSSDGRTVAVSGTNKVSYFRIATGHGKK